MNAIVRTQHLPCQEAIFRILSADHSRLYPARKCLAPVNRGRYTRACRLSCRWGDIFCAAHGGACDRLISAQLRTMIDERQAREAWLEEQSMSSFWAWWDEEVEATTENRLWWAERDADQMAREQGVVYFLVRYDSIKIGTTTRLRQRMESMQHPLSDLLGIIPGGPCVEREWHKRFRHLRTHGEWFRPADELLDAIASAAVQPRAMDVA